MDSHVWSVVIPADSQCPSGRLFHAAAVVSDSMFVFGGTIESGGINVRSGDMYKFQFSSYPKCTLSEDYGKFLVNKQFCDIVFIVGPDETKILAHIAIVAARSLYLKTKIIAAKESRNNHFEKLFGTTEVQFNAELPQLEVKLPAISPEAFERVLYYIYTDIIEFKDPYFNQKIVNLMMDVNLIAQQFNIPRLEQLCMQYLEFKIVKSNVLEALFNSDRLNLQSIKEYCLNYIVKEDLFYDIVMSSEFASLEKSLIVEVIRKKLNPSKQVVDIKFDKSIGTTLESDMAVFLKTTGKEFCDINLVLENNVIPAHKAILAARCAYFEAMFRSFNPADNIVQIGSFNPVEHGLTSPPSLESFNSLLRYIYYGETKMPTEDSLYLFQAPCFYGFTNNRLQAFCKNNLENNINYENVLKILEASDKMNVPDIKSYALKLIVHDFSLVVRSPKMKLLSRELLLDIINSMADVLGESKISHDLLSSISVHSDI